MKIVYSYDHEGKYIGEAQADLCQITERLKLYKPETESVFIFPGNTTEIAPPKHDHYWNAFFVNGAWSLKEKNPKPKAL